MCLEDGDDRGADPLRLLPVACDEGVVRIDDGEPGMARAPEQVRGAARLVLEEGPEDHRGRRYLRLLNRARRSCRSLLSVPVMTTTMLGGLWASTRMRLLVQIERQGSLSSAAAEVG